MSDASASGPVIIRRYARSRRYDAAGGRYVSMGTLRLWHMRGIAFTVLDAESGEDVTRILLA
jgi:polyhydroxyalkanoate synthesis regulator protein